MVIELVQETDRRTTVITEVYQGHSFPCLNARPKSPQQGNVVRFPSSTRWTPNEKPLQPFNVLLSF